MFGSEESSSLAERVLVAELVALQPPPAPPPPVSPQHRYPLSGPDAQTPLVQSALLAQLLTWHFLK